MGSLLRFLRPVTLLKRRALLKGVFGGDRGWLAIGAVMWLGSRFKGLFGFREPKTVMVQEIKEGERFVLAHSESVRRRKKKRR